MEVVLRFPTSDRLGPPGPYPPGEGGGGYHIKYTVGLTVTAESEGYELSFIVKNIPADHINSGRLRLRSEVCSFHPLFP